MCRKKDLVTVAEGQTLDLNCVVAGQAHAPVTWYKRGGTLPARHQVPGGRKVGGGQPGLHSRPQGAEGAELGGTGYGAPAGLWEAPRSHPCLRLSRCVAPACTSSRPPQRTQASMSAGPATAWRPPSQSQSPRPRAPTSPTVSGASRPGLGGKRGKAGAAAEA